MKFLPSARAAGSRGPSSWLEAFGGPGVLAEAVRKSLFKKGACVRVRERLVGWSLGWLVACWLCLDVLPL